MSSLMKEKGSEVLGCRAAMVPFHGRSVTDQSPLEDGMTKELLETGVTTASAAAQTKARKRRTRQRRAEAPMTEAGWSCKICVSMECVK